MFCPKQAEEQHDNRPIKDRRAVYSHCRREKIERLIPLEMRDYRMLTFLVTYPCSRTKDSTVMRRIVCSEWFTVRGDHYVVEPHPSGSARLMC